MTIVMGESFPHIEPVMKAQEKSPLDEKLEREILPMLTALCPDDEPLEQYEAETMEELLADVKKLQSARGENFVGPEETLDEEKELLKFRLKTALSDYYKSNRSKPEKGLNADFARKAKLALFSVRDFSHFAETHGLENVDPQDVERGRLSYYLEVGSYYKRKFTERELDILLKSGFGKTLATIQSFEFDKYFEAVPESLLRKMIKHRGHDGTSIGRLIEEYPSKEKYSRDTFKELEVVGYDWTSLKNIGRFRDVDFKEAVLAYSPKYPYQAERIIELLRSLNLPEKDFKENLDYIVRHQEITDDDTRKVPELKGQYGNIIADVESLGQETYKERSEIMRSLIKRGFISFLYQDRGYIQDLAKDDYEWLLNQVKYYDQEHLLMHNINYLKAEDQRDYAKKLIAQDKDYLVISGSISVHHRALFSDGVFDQEIFDALSGRAYQIPIRKFRGLNEKTFEALRQRNSHSFTGIELIENICSFTFADEQKYAKYIGYQKVLAEPIFEAFLLSYRDYANSNSTINSVLDKLLESTEEERETYSQIISAIDKQQPFFRRALDSSFAYDKPLQAFVKFKSEIKNFDPDIINFMLKTKGKEILGSPVDIIEKGIPEEAAEGIHAYEKAFADGKPRSPHPASSLYSHH